MEGNRIDIDRLFHALGDRTRRTILDRLSSGPASVSRLAEPLGITLTAVTQHLQILEEVRLVHSEKLGRVRHLPHLSLPDFALWSNGFLTIARCGNENSTAWESSWLRKTRACWLKKIRAFFRAFRMWTGCGNTRSGGRRWESASVASLKFIEEQPQVLRLTTPELKDVRGPVRSE